MRHGLEGSAQSHYLLGMSKKAYAAGFHTLRMNTRNCGGREHLTPILNCAGLSQVVAVRPRCELCGEICLQMPPRVTDCLVKT